MVGRDPRNLFPPFVSHALGRSRAADQEISRRGGARRRFRAASRRDPRHRRPRRPWTGRFHDRPLRRHPRRGRRSSASPRTAAAARNAPFAKVAEANAAGVAYVPADRRKEGLLLPHSIDFNLLLPLFARHSRERRRAAQETRSPNVWRSASTSRATGAGRRRRCRAATSRRSRWRNGCRSSRRSCC